MPQERTPQVIPSTVFSTSRYANHSRKSHNADYLDSSEFAYSSACDRDRTKITVKSPELTSVRHLLVVGALLAEAIRTPRGRSGNRPCDQSQNFPNLPNNIGKCPKLRGHHLVDENNPVSSFDVTEKWRFSPHPAKRLVDDRGEGASTHDLFYVFDSDSMTPDQIDRLILSAYPDGYRADTVTPLFPSTALGRCRYWMVETPEGTFCLRRWPKEQTNIERLQFIQAVLWNAVCEGIEIVPLPLETREQKGIVHCDGAFWELLPWIGDFPNFASESFHSDFLVDEKEKNDWERLADGPFKIASAMFALAQFHEAVADFPLPDPPQTVSVGINERLSQCQMWMSGRLETLRRTLEGVCELPQNDEELCLARIGLEYLDWIVPLSRTTIVLLNQAARLPIGVQPVIRNACLRHLRFDDDGVCGMIDFTELGVDAVALDVAMLLGSLTDGDSADWNYGLKTYQTIRSLSENERSLTTAFDASQMFLEGLGYLDAVFLREEPFTIRQLVEIQQRMERLVHRLCSDNQRRHSA